LRPFASERPPPRLRYAHPRDLDRAPAGNHVLGVCARKSVAHEIAQQLDRKAMR
jgi:hypothetical protein